MLALKEFHIPFVGLALGKHFYSFRIGEKFFACFESGEVETGDIKCQLSLEKKSDMLILDFSLEGFVDIQCDLCLEDYPQEINSNKCLYVKFGEYYQEPTDEIIVIPAGQQEINIAQYAYEFIILGLPQKRVHPGGIGDRLNCDKEAIKKLEKYLSKGGSKKQDNESTDSRWDELKKLKFD